MSDNGTAASGPTVAWDDIGSVAYQRVKVTWGADGTANDASAANPLPVTVPGSVAVTGTFWQATQPVSGTFWQATQPVSISAGLGAFDVQTSFTRPADTAVYAINDALSDSTSAPTAGGFTLSSVAGASGGTVMITDLLITSSAPASLQGTLFIFNQAATAINDNAAWNLSDSDIANAVAVIPFVLTADANNSRAHLQGLSVVMTCSGSANLRYLIKVDAAYTPISGEVIKVRAKGLRLT